jgi:hypothetical protein
MAKGQNVNESIPLTWTPCHYGGQRPWFRCPGWGCGRRVAKLYLGDGAFRCRHCLDLGCESQRETPAFRLLAKAQNIRLRLGGSASLTEPFPSKPKGMHGCTYARLRWQVQVIGGASTLLPTFLVYLAYLSARGKVRPMDVAPIAWPPTPGPP